MKNVIICVILVTAVFVFAECGRAPPEANNSDSIKTYRDIPGITEEEITAIEAIKKTRKELLYGQMMETEAFIQLDGTHAGFAVKICELLSGLFGIEFVLKIYDWDSLVGGLDAGVIDFTGDLTPTPERTQLYYMTDPIAVRSQRIFTSSEKEVLNEKDINGHKIGFLTGSIDADVVKEYYPELFFYIVDVDSLDLAASMLRSGEIDAFVTEGVLDPLVEEYGFIYSKEFFPLVNTNVSITTANPELKSVIAVVNKYISAGGSEELFGFYRDGHDEFIRHKLKKRFTEQEKTYIDNLAMSGAKVRIALEHDNYPFSFFDVSKKEFQGIAVDVLSEIGRLTGMEYEVENDETTPWAEILEMIRTGKVSLVSQLLQSEERKGLFLWTDRPYASAYYALLSKSDYPDLAIYQVARTRVGTISKSAFEDKYHQWLPGNENSIPYNTQIEALDALESGEIDLLMGSEYMLLMQQNYREKPGYKVNIRFGIPMESYFGLNKNEEILCSIINKSQIFLNTDLIASKWANRGYDYVKEMARQRLRFFMLLAVALSLILFLTIIILVKNRKLNHTLDKTVKERTRDLEKQTKAAQVASKAKSLFLATMSHELRTPLNAIIGMTDIAKKAISNQEKTLASIDQIRSSSHHLLSLVNNVLDMAKIEAGKLELSFEPFDSRDAYAEVVKIIEQLCSDKKIKFIYPTDEIKKMNLIGDRQRLNQVVMNLLRNAVKFTPEGGEIRFSITVLEEDDECIKCHFLVSDTGIGMTGEQMGRLFVPFEQVDSAIAAKYGGTGLGLSISQYLISSMGGIIGAESIPNAGSKFYFDLIFKKDIEIGQQETAIELSDLSGKRILLVDDIDLNRMIVTELLTPIGIEIDEAENGQQAVAQFSNSQPGYYDLIFMDLQMPVMGGHEAAKTIRSLDHPDSKKIQIVAMTANAYQEDIEEALSSGMNGLIPKPIDIDTVMNTLAKFIGTKH